MWKAWKSRGSVMRVLTKICKCIYFVDHSFVVKLASLPVTTHLIVSWYYFVLFQNVFIVGKNTCSNFKLFDTETNWFNAKFCSSLQAYSIQLLLPSSLLHPNPTTRAHVQSLHSRHTKRAHEFSWVNFFFRVWC